MRKSDYELILEGTPLISGGFVCDLIGTGKPGAKWADAALVAASQCLMRDLCRCVYRAIEEDAEANGYSISEARMNAVWAQLDLMAGNPIVPTPPTLND
jgi:hypothetical protein